MPSQGYSFSPGWQDNQFLRPRQATFWASAGNWCLASSSRVKLPVCWTGWDIWEREQSRKMVMAEEKRARKKWRSSLLFIYVLLLCYLLLLLLSSALHFIKALGLWNPVSWSSYKWLWLEIISTLVALILFYCETTFLSRMEYSSEPSWRIPSFKREDIGGWTMSQGKPNLFVSFMELLRKILILMIFYFATI